MSRFSFSPFEISLESSELEVRNALARILENLTPLALTEEEASAVELVLAEVLNNVIEHAYPVSDTGNVRLTCHHKQDGLHFNIYDRGVAMPDGQLPVGNLSQHNVDLEDLPEGGFGWFLIQHLAKDLDYQRTAGQNRLSLRIAVAL